jgi:predicted Kef-type K+ transport protein
MATDLHEMAMIVVRLCVGMLVAVGCLMAVTVLTFPGMFDSPRTDVAASVMQSSLAIGFLACCGYILIGIVVVRWGMIVPWIERGGYIGQVVEEATDQES